VLVGSEAEVLNSLPGVLWSSQEKGVAAGWGPQSQLVQGDSLTTSGLDSCTGGGSEPESSDRKLGDSEDTVVISDGANDDNSSLPILLTGVGVVGMAHDLGDGDGRAVDLGHEEAAEDGLVERRVGTASQKPVQLHEKLEVDIVGFGCLAVVRRSPVVKIDTHGAGGCG